MRTSISRRLLASSALAAALWLLFAVVRWAFSQIQGGAAQLALLVPEVVPSGLLWGESGPWLILTVVIGGIAVALAHALFTAAAGRGGTMLVAAWFATVAAGALVGLALDIAGAWGSLAVFGPRGLLVGEFGAAAASGALWGLAVGWMPGLVARTPAPAAGDADEPVSRDAATRLALAGRGRRRDRRAHDRRGRRQRAHCRDRGGCRRAAGGRGCCHLRRPARPRRARGAGARQGGRRPPISTRSGARPKRRCC